MSESIIHSASNSSNVKIAISGALKSTTFTKQTRQTQSPTPIISPKVIDAGVTLVITVIGVLISSALVYWLNNIWHRYTFPDVNFGIFRRVDGRPVLQVTKTLTQEETVASACGAQFYSQLTCNKWFSESEWQISITAVPMGNANLRHKLLIDDPKTYFIFKDKLTNQVMVPIGQVNVDFPAPMVQAEKIEFSILVFNGAYTKLYPFTVTFLPYNFTIKTEHTV